MSNPWDSIEGKVVWKKEAEYWSWLRGALRKLWSDYPVRKVWKQSQLRPLTQEEKDSKKFHTSTKNVGQCSFCKEWFAGSKLECDHLIESDGCTSKETAESFLWHCGGLTAESFRLACKPCHKIQSYAQRRGISYEEARIEKQVIQIIKEKKDKQFLEERGIKPASNQAARREQVKEVLLNEMLLFGIKD